jgi:hypothetical protein
VTAKIEFSQQSLVYKISFRWSQRFGNFACGQTEMAGTMKLGFIFLNTIQNGIQDYFNIKLN